jgi:transposase, IS5 family
VLQDFSGWGAKILQNLTDLFPVWAKHDSLSACIAREGRVIMRPPKPSARGQTDMFRARLDQILNLDHELVRLARLIDWGFIEERCGAAYSDVAGHPPLPTRLMAGLAILKHTYDLSDEGLCARWIENPYFQFFCGEEFFRHDLIFDRSSITRWRQRMGEERLNALVQESLAVGLKTKALRVSDLAQVIVDTTVQEKAVMFPTDARLLDRARVRLVKLAKKRGVKLRQTYVRVGKLALMKHQRYAHAKQFGRAKRQLRSLRTYLGRVMRDIERAVKVQPILNGLFRRELFNAGRALEQKRGRRKPSDPPPKFAPIYSLHAPEVECIGKGKAHKPYEFGVKVSVTTTLKRSPGGQFVLNAKALPGRPYDGHTLAPVIPAIEAITGVEVKRIIADAGYRGGNAPAPYDMRVYTSGQKRRMTNTIKRTMGRRAAVEPVIGHMKSDHRMNRNFLAHATGDAINAVLAAVGNNFRRLLAWLALWLALMACTLRAHQQYATA